MPPRPALTEDIYPLIFIHLDSAKRPDRIALARCMRVSKIFHELCWSILYDRMVISAQLGKPRRSFMRRFPNPYHTNQESFRDPPRPYVPLLIAATDVQRSTLHYNRRELDRVRAFILRSEERKITQNSAAILLLHSMYMAEAHDVPRLSILRIEIELEEEEELLPFGWTLPVEPERDSIKYSKLVLVELRPFRPSNYNGAFPLVPILPELLIAA